MKLVVGEAYESMRNDLPSPSSNEYPEECVDYEEDEEGMMNVNALLEQSMGSPLAENGEADADSADENADLDDSKELGEDDQEDCLLIDELPEPEVELDLQEGDEVQDEEDEEDEIDPIPEDIEMLEDEHEDEEEDDEAEDDEDGQCDYEQLAAGHPSPIRPPPPLVKCRQPEYDLD